MKKYEIFKKLVWMMTIIWMILIFYFSSQPADISRVQSGEILVKMNMLSEDEVNITDNWRIFKLQNAIRKSAHFIEYFTFGVLMTLSIIFLELKFKYTHNLIISWLICSSYAATDELHQYFVPGRGAMLRDVYLDSIASLTAVVVVALVMYILKLRLNFSRGERR